MCITEEQFAFNSVSNTVTKHYHKCLYCHDNEHSRYTDQQYFGEGSLSTPKIAKATHNPFAALAGLMKKED
jgi:hypothetical protein